MEYKGFEVRAKVVQESLYEVDDEGNLLRQDPDSVEEPAIVGFVVTGPDDEEFEVDGELLDDVLDEIDEVVEVEDAAVLN